MWRKLLKIINQLVTTLLTITLLITLFLVISSKITGKDANLFGYQIKTVLSGSMEPEMETGSIIFIETEGDTTQFQENDVITFLTEENTTVTHRITEVIEGGEQYMTKGDANEAVDPQPVFAENIVGTYTGISIPYAGYVLSFATSKQGAALLLIVPGILLLINSFIIIWRVVQYVQNDKQKNIKEVNL
ncbi:signal peptidase I SipW [Pseudogracilibacillus sp. SO30301A]|uniref:signal peptidase I SipW n=1 Tax=Pseudogracilibacillus sp. SO30301A TaxID=3098291 RepID=UPI00300E4C31